jgi:hypothetical protein
VKVRSPIITVGVALVGILILSIGLIALGSKESQAFPSVDSYLPSGASAFADVLRQSHYNVAVDARTKPLLQKNDVVIAFVPVVQNGPSFTKSEADIEQTLATHEVIDAFVTAGGSVISLPMSPDFADQSKTNYDLSQDVVSARGIHAKVTWTGGSPIDEPYLSSNQKPIQIWGTTAIQDGQAVARSPLVRLNRVGKGQELSFGNGILATNRFIDRQQNALVLMDAIHTIAPSNARIVFAEATFGNAKDPGFFATIGPWAVAAWFQLIFLGLVVVYTLGKPFGLPDPERRQERGTRELMDAMAQTLRRGRMTKLALRTVFDDTNRFLRKRYGGRREGDRYEQQLGTLPDLYRALNRVEAAAEIGAPEDMAAKLIQDVEQCVRDAGPKTGTPY